MLLWASKIKWRWHYMIWTYAQTLYECFILPLYALKYTLDPCLNLCSILQHMVGLRWPSSHSHQPISASLEVRTCHLSKSWSLLLNYMILCHNWLNTQTLYAHKTWENMGIMLREMGEEPKTSTLNKSKTRKEQLKLNHWQKSSVHSHCLGRTCVVCEITDKSVYWVNHHGEQVLFSLKDC